MSVFKIWQIDKNQYALSFIKLVENKYQNLHLLTELVAFNTIQYSILTFAFNQNLVQSNMISAALRLHNYCKILNFKKVKKKKKCDVFGSC